MGKSMKKLSLLSVVVAGILLSSCKKEVSPELEITVVDSLNAPVNQAKVKLSVDGAVFGIVNEKAIDSTLTDAFGKAYFDLDNTILVDVSLYNRENKKVDSTSMLLETKKLKRNEENVYETKMVFN
jgi:hypothetical protein